MSADVPVCPQFRDRTCVRSLSDEACVWCGRPVATAPSTQVHAPPTEAEVAASPSKSVTPPRVYYWAENVGWCSACRADDVRVAHLGTSRRNVALCELCLAKLNRAMQRYRVADAVFGELADVADAEREAEADAASARDVIAAMTSELDEVDP